MNSLPSRETVTAEGATQRRLAGNQPRPNVPCASCAFKQPIISQIPAYGPGPWPCARQALCRRGCPPQSYRRSLMGAPAQAQSGCYLPASLLLRVLSSQANRSLRSPCDCRSVRRHLCARMHACLVGSACAFVRAHTDVHVMRDSAVCLCVRVLGMHERVRVRTCVMWCHLRACVRACVQVHQADIRG